MFRLRNVLVLCVSSAALALAPSAVRADTTVSYEPGSPPCTTKTVEQHKSSVPRPDLRNTDAWFGVAPPSTITRFPRGETVNDFAGRFFGMESGMVTQPNDSASKITRTPSSTPANGQTVLVVSSCQNHG